MLKTPADYPNVGSFALFIDDTLPPAQQRAELVRVLRRHSHAGGGARFEMAVLAFPLRQGASGTKTVDLAQVIDGTPLTRPEERELTDLEGKLRGRTRLSPRLVALKRRADALRHRLVVSALMTAELRKLFTLEAKAQPSIGGRLPQEIAA